MFFILANVPLRHLLDEKTLFMSLRRSIPSKNKVNDLFRLKSKNIVLYLLDNVPNQVVGCIIQKRYIYTVKLFFISDTKYTYLINHRSISTKILSGLYTLRIVEGLSIELAAKMQRTAKTGRTNQTANSRPIAGLKKRQRNFKCLLAF